MSAEYVTNDKPLITCNIKVEPRKDHIFTVLDVRGVFDLSLRFRKVKRDLVHTLSLNGPTAFRLLKH